MDAKKEKTESLNGYPSDTTLGSPNSSAASQPLEATIAQALHRQSLALERLADLLPQLIAQNQMMLQALVSSDEEDDVPQETYLDGSPV